MNPARPRIQDYVDDFLWVTAMCAINGYSDPKLLPGNRYACLSRMAFTTAILLGEVGDADVYLDRWCYNTPAVARPALDVWDGTGEPQGWHRHPASGRRLAPPEGRTYDEQGRLVPPGTLYICR